MEGPPTTLRLETGPFTPASAELLRRARRRARRRRRLFVPAGLILALVLVYCGTTLLWPLNAVAPTVTALAIQPTAAAAASPAWPSEGSAAVAVAGVGATAASTSEAASMASITKIVTALVVLDQLPMELGEDGTTFEFTTADRTAYWAALAAGESALDVPVDGSLTEYQMLQGMLIGSACNYADRLASDIWGTDALYASAATSWLTAHGISGITIVEPSGIDSGNTATPAALIALGELAMADPVIAEIVGTTSVDLPGVGTVTNTNTLLADTGVVGIKTGTLDTYDLLAAEDVTISDIPVRIYAAVLGQADDDARNAAVRALFAQTEAELAPITAVTAGTTVGEVDTRWSDPVPIVTTSDADVVLWNGATATTSATFDLGDSREDGDLVGTLTVTGGANEVSVDAVLTVDITDPSPWWRLTHPLELFGLL
ncbi:MAG: D-alanyl-D-alanine carboxypeptidase [Microbacterium sp.]